MRNKNIKNALSVGKILSDKQRKNVSILGLVIKKGPISRTEISRISGLNIVTISNYVNEFIDSGLVTEKGFDVSTGGRRPTLVELNPKFGYVMGVGLAANNITGILANPNMEVVCEVKKECSEENGEAIIGKLVETVEDLLNKSKVDTSKIKGLGVGIPGIIDEDGQTIKWLGPLGISMVSISGISLKDIFEKEFDIPTLVEHDAACAVFGEHWFGFEADVMDMLYMYSGVSCGLIINGRIYRGASNSAGELGIFNPSEPSADARRDESLNLGTWELDLGVVYSAKKALKEGIKSRIFELTQNKTDNIDLKTVIEASKGGDKLASDLLESAGRNLGKKVAFLVNLLNPEVVVIGGGMEQAGSLFMDSVKRSVHSWSREESCRGLKIVPARLGYNAISTGAACLVLQRIFMNA